MFGSFPQFLFVVYATFAQFLWLVFPHFPEGRRKGRRKRLRIVPFRVPDFTAVRDILNIPLEQLASTQSIPSRAIGLFPGKRPMSTFVVCPLICNKRLEVHTSDRPYCLVLCHSSSVDFLLLSYSLCIPSSQRAVDLQVPDLEATSLN
jgi:hypothetical protein